MTTYDQIQALFNEKSEYRIIDGRPKEAFTAGNIPGSVNIPMYSLILDGFIRDKSEVSAIFKKAGVNMDAPMIFSCNSGVMASFLLAAAQSTKCNGSISVYDGAWAEYSKKAANAMN